MEKGISERVFSAGALLVSKDSKTVHSSVHGILSFDQGAEKTTPETCFDLASLTKVLVTTPLVLDLVSCGRLELDQKISEIIPNYSGDLKDEISIAHLLEHSSGLPAWEAYYEEVAAFGGGRELATIKGRDAVRAMVAAEQPLEKPGTFALYSDLGFILLDWIIEIVSKKTIDVLAKERLFKPLKLTDLFFIDLKNPRQASRARKNRDFARTEKCPWRGRVLSGEVHDDNTYAMGGISGHAGLFGTPAAVMTLAETWLKSYEGPKGFFDQELVRLFWRRSKVKGSTRALGFDTPSAKGSTSGRYFSRSSVGHTGFSGTSLWIDPVRRLIVVLLTNRVHPSRENEAIKKFRPKIHDQVVNIFG
jgi:CubicO group peptidase (beta-lactamase class C family)